jgi:O-antigen/teichoic acid export membrane protein
LLGWIGSVYSLRSHIKDSGGIKYFKKEVVVVCFKKGLHILLAGIGGFVMSRICIYFVEIFSGSRAVGLYVAAIAIPNMILGIPQQIGTALYTHISNKNFDQQAGSMIAGMCNIIILASFIIFLLVFPLRSELVVLFFGDEFLEADNTLVVLMIWAFVSGVSGIILNAYAARGKHRYGTYLTFITLIVLVLFGPSAIIKYGIFGASIVQLTCSVIGFGFLLINFKSEFGLSSVKIILPSKKNIGSYLDLS